MNSNENLENALYVCTFEGCNKYFKKRSKLTYHSGKHTGKRPFKCEVENCNKSYTNPAHLRRHKKITHDKFVKAESILCTYEGCLRIFSNRYSLKKHCNLKHNANRKFPFNCKQCSEGFTRKRQLLKHSYVHTGIAPFKCDQCEARFLTMVDCNRHKRTHTVYTCECGEKYERWLFFLSHKKECAQARPKCTVCSKSCSNSTNLKIHELVHKDKMEKDVFPCIYENCTRFYFYKKNLHHHISEFHKKERNEPKIPCVFENCKQLFKKKQYLKNHLKNVHMKEKKIKQKKERKDKNVPRKSLAGILADVDLPVNPSEEVISNIFLDAIEEHNEV
ncbi:zinc finger protein 675 [Agrilus planipennis]|uniref:Zinc finger protein 675 n=1 Tax=Agrilus planipennis TaxID=224129 RepID=A0A1W4X372_AGRPL|nr:zinc finger protein 675 [Agrilus planipennis]